MSSIRIHEVKITLNFRCECYSNKVTQRTTPKSDTMLRDMQQRYQYLQLYRGGYRCMNRCGELVE